MMDFSIIKLIVNQNTVNMLFCNASVFRISFPERTKGFSSLVLVGSLAQPGDKVVPEGVTAGSRIGCLTDVN